MDTIAQETHEALLRKAVEDATAAAQAEIAELTEKVTNITSEFEAASARVSELEEASEQASAELDQAQVQLRAATEERDQLQADIAQRDKDAEVAEIASKRAEQVRNLGLFPEDYIADKAQVWAAVSEEDWASRVDEWKQAKGVTTGDGGASETLPVEQASAMTGSAPSTSTTKPSPRRQVLGLD